MNCSSVRALISDAGCALLVHARGPRLKVQREILSLKFTSSHILYTE